MKKLFSLFLVGATMAGAVAAFVNALKDTETEEEDEEVTLVSVDKTEEQPEPEVDETPVEQPLEDVPVVEVVTEEVDDLVKEFEELLTQEEITEPEEPVEEPVAEEPAMEEPEEDSVDEIAQMVQQMVGAIDVPTEEEFAEEEPVTEKPVVEEPVVEEPVVEEPVVEEPVAEPVVEEPVAEQPAEEMTLEEMYPNISESKMVKIKANVLKMYNQLSSYEVALLNHFVVFTDEDSAEEFRAHVNELGGKDISTSEKEVSFELPCKVSEEAFLQGILSLANEAIDYRGQYKGWKVVSAN